MNRFLLILALAITLGTAMATNTTTACTQQHTVTLGETCASLLLNGTTLARFLSWNPDVNANCDNLVAGKAYCVSMASSSTDPPSSPNSAGSPRVATILGGVFGGIACLVVACALAVSCTRRRNRRRAARDRGIELAARPKRPVFLPGTTFAPLPTASAYRGRAVDVSDPGEWTYAGPDVRLGRFLWIGPSGAVAHCVVDGRVAYLTGGTLGGV